MKHYSISARHRLQYSGADVKFVPLRKPEGDKMLTRRFLVMHFTGGWSLESTISYWRTAAAKGAGAHILIDRDGTVVQCRPFNQTAGHAGPSKWTDPKTGVVYRGLNSCSIGIELCNCGDLARINYPVGMGDLTGTPIPRISASHKNGGPVKKWETFDEDQISVAQQIASVLVSRYKLDDVVGHDDIAPDRKNDPGPAFPMGLFRQSLGFPSSYP